MKENIYDYIKQFTPQKNAFRFRSKKLPIIKGEELIPSKDISFKIEDSSRNWRILVLTGAVFLIFFFFSSRAYVLQVIKKDISTEMADRNRVRMLLLQPERGVVYDRNGKYIVRNKPAFSLDMSLNICSLNSGGGLEGIAVCKSLVSDLSNMVPMDTVRIFKEIDEKKSNVILVSGLTKEQLLPIEANLSKYPGVSVVTAPQRDYLYSDAFAHLIGYVGIGGDTSSSIVGKMGVEQSYDKNIAGTFGERVIQVDAAGNFLSTVSEKSPVAGHNVTLYTDLDLQNKAYELLKKTVESKKADAGVIVAEDPNTGGILALVSYPAFDPNKLSGGISSSDLNTLLNNTSYPFFNRAMAG